MRGRGGWEAKGLVVLFGCCIVSSAARGWRPARARPQRRILTNHQTVARTAHARAEGWLSGLRHLTRNQAYGKPYREFKSHPFRHFFIHLSHVLSLPKLLMESSTFSRRTRDSRESENRALHRQSPGWPCRSRPVNFGPPRRTSVQLAPPLHSRSRSRRTGASHRTLVKR